MTYIELRNLIYCDFHDPFADKKLYVEVKDLDFLTLVAEEYLEEYNSISRTPMNLVLFRFPSIHLPSISSIQRRGNNRFAVFQIRHRTSVEDQSYNDATPGPRAVDRRGRFRASIDDEIGGPHLGLRIIPSGDIPGVRYLRVARGREGYP